MQKEDLDETTHSPSFIEQNQTLCNGTLLQGESKEILQGTQNHFDMLMTLPEDSVTMNDDNPHVRKRTTSDDVMISPEFRRTLANLNETDDVDSLIGEAMDYIAATSNESSDILSFTQSVAQAAQAKKVLTAGDMTCNNVTENITTEYEKRRRRELQKKDNHNIIERRRRSNINERITELASLLPEAILSHLPMHKGSILKATVKYVKDLKKDQERLKMIEAKQSNMKSEQRKMQIRIFELELKLNLCKRLSKCTHERIKKKPKKRSIKETENILEGFMNFKLLDRLNHLQMSENKRNQLFQLLYTNANLQANKTPVLQNCSYDNLCYQKGMPLKAPNVLIDQQTHIYNEFATMEDTNDSDNEMEYVQHGMNEMHVPSYHLNSNVLRKAECVFESTKTDASLEEMSTAENMTPTCSSEPRLHQTNFLKSLLLSSTIVRSQNSEYNNVENSVGTFSSKQ